MISTENLRSFVVESFRIEGIELYSDSENQIASAKKFLEQVPSIESVLVLLSHIEPLAVLRDRQGLNVRIGNRRAPPGGPEIKEKLEYLLTELRVSPRRWHIEFEHLHPFTDGNGRVGRMIWLHQMMKRGYDGQLGFLHEWYYRSFGD